MSLFGAISGRDGIKICCLLIPMFEIDNNYLQLLSHYFQCFYYLIDYSVLALVRSARHPRES